MENGYMQIVLGCLQDQIHSFVRSAFNAFNKLLSIIFQFIFFHVGISFFPHQTGKRTFAKNCMLIKKINIWFIWKYPCFVQWSNCSCYYRSWNKSFGCICIWVILKQKLSISSYPPFPIALIIKPFKRDTP